MARFIWFQGPRALSRLQREISSLESHLQQCDASLQLTLWYAESLAQLQGSKLFLGRGDVEGGWLCLHAAQRLLINGMSPEELHCEALSIQAESEKLGGWRRNAIKAILGDLTSITAPELIYAAKLRDEYHANQYQKIWLTSDQLKLLCCVCGLVVICGLAGLFFLPTSDDPFAPRTIVSVVFFGVIGSAFSVGQSIIGMASSSRIPELVANHWTTFMRTMFGSVTGLAGYVFYKSQILQLTIGKDDHQIYVPLSIAFIFGFAGEKLINKIVDTFNASGPGGSKS